VKLAVAGLVNNSYYQPTDAFVRKNKNTVLASRRNVFACSCRCHKQFSEAVHDSRQSLQIRLHSTVSANSALNLGISQHDIPKASAPQNCGLSVRVPVLLVRRIFNDVVLNVNAFSQSEKVK
jgi:hypothetical protein